MPGGRRKAKASTQTPITAAPPSSRRLRRCAEGEAEGGEAGLWSSMERAVHSPCGGGGARIGKDPTAGAGLVSSAMVGLWQCVASIKCLSLEWMVSCVHVTAGWTSGWWRGGTRAEYPNHWRRHCGGVGGSCLAGLFEIATHLRASIHWHYGAKRAGQQGNQPCDGKGDRKITRGWLGMATHIAQQRQDRSGHSNPGGEHYMLHGRVDALGLTHLVGREIGLVHGIIFLELAGLRGPCDFQP